MHGLTIGNHLAANVRMILSPQNRSLNWIDADQTITPMQYEPHPMWSRMRADQLVVVKILRNGQTQRRVRGRGPKLRLVISRKCKSRLGIYIAKQTLPPDNRVRGSVHGFEQIDTNQLNREVREGHLTDHQMIK